MKFVLIAIFMYGSPQPMNVDFETEAACIEAKEKIESDKMVRFYVKFIDCFPKG